VDTRGEQHVMGTRGGIRGAGKRHDVGGDASVAVGREKEWS
jgi:hypothetical protein